MRTPTILIAALVAAPSLAHATPSTESRVGLGLGVGIATGPNLQVMTSSTTHLDVGFGVELGDRLRLQADHDWRLVDLSGADTVRVPMYVGVGGFFSGWDTGNTESGVRMPLGVQADFARAPIQLFGELSPEVVLLQVVDANTAPAEEVVALTGLMGVRATF
jgi:hypothetical protein